MSKKRNTKHQVRVAFSSFFMSSTLSVTLLVIFFVGMAIFIPWAWKTDFHFWIKPYFVEIALPDSNLQVDSVRSFPRGIYYASDLEDDGGERYIHGRPRASQRFFRSKDHNYYYISKDIYKFNEKGEVLWKTNYCKKADEMGNVRYCLPLGQIATKDGGIILFGQRHIKRFDATTGQLLWEHLSLDHLYNFQYGIETADGFVFIETNMDDFPHDRNENFKPRYWLYKFDNQGHLLWKRNLIKAYPQLFISRENQLAVNKQNEIILRFVNSNHIPALYKIPNNDWVFVTLNTEGKEQHREYISPNDMRCLSDSYKGYQDKQVIINWSKEAEKYRSICVQHHNEHKLYLDSFGSNYIVGCKKIGGIMKMVHHNFCRPFIKYTQFSHSKLGKIEKEEVRFFRELSFFQRGGGGRDIFIGENNNELYFFRNKRLRKFRLIN